MLEKWNEIPKELVLGWPRSVLLGDEKLIVEQHQGIYACTQEEIVLRTSFQNQPIIQNPIGNSEAILHGLSPSPAPYASHEACRRAAVWPRQPAGSRTRPASREACRRAVVKPRPAFMSPEHPAR